MNSSVETFYRDTLAGWTRDPYHNFQPDDFQACFPAFNHYCGDELDIYLAFKQNRVSGYFTGEACAICCASTSAMMQSIEGKSIEQVSLLVAQALAFFAAIADPDKANVADPLTELNPSEGAAAVAFLLPVKKFPVRLQCPTLSWRALQANLPHHSADD